MFFSDETIDLIDSDDDTNCTQQGPDNVSHETANKSDQRPDSCCSVVWQVETVSESSKQRVKEEEPKQKSDEAAKNMEDPIDIPISGKSNFNYSLRTILIDWFPMELSSSYTIINKNK